jgi:hypothetical protein
MKVADRGVFWDETKHGLDHLVRCGASTFHSGTYSLRVPHTGLGCGCSLRSDAHAHTPLQNVLVFITSGLKNFSMITPRMPEATELPRNQPRKLKGMASEVIMPKL